MYMLNDEDIFYLAARTEWGMTETQVGSLHYTNITPTQTGLNQLKQLYLINTNCAAIFLLMSEVED